MDTGRFDTLSRSLPFRLSRRSAIQASGLGLAAGLVATASQRVVAQDATPDPSSDDATFLFVQSATSGSFVANPAAGTPTANGTPVAGAGADYLLTLTGHTGHTVYFSDRPERIFGEAPTQTFLDGLGFPVDNPPNAALVTMDENGNEDILVIELFSPSFDTEAGSVSYGVNILSDYEGGLGFVAGRQQDEDLGGSFGSASLFIDDCPDDTPSCHNTDTCDLVGSLGPKGMCWDWYSLQCLPCSGPGSWTQQCNEQFPACAGTCTSDPICDGHVF